MKTCPYCKGEILTIQTTVNYEAGVLKINRVHMCRKCKRVYVANEGYKRVYGVPLNAEVSVQRAGGL